jgi:ribose transport system ATP-binding protein
LEQAQFSEFTVPENIILEMNSISKSFGGVHALRDVNFSCKKGSVHALVGENGAGKSTLLRILSGELKADSGSIVLSGRPVHFNGPWDARKLGIAMVHQELKLLPEMTVAQNIFLNNEPRGFFNLINEKAYYREAVEMIERYDLQISPYDLVGDLSIAQQQMVEILKLLSKNPEIIILDEPTSSLAKEEVEKLYLIIEKLTAAGKTIIFISHRLEEIFRICDEATVLKDGRFINCVPVKEIDQDELIKLMVGRPLLSMFPPKAEDKGDEIFELNGLCVEGKLKDITFRVKKGEVLGIAGLQGHGQTELLNCIAGIIRKDKGTIKIGGEKIPLRTPLQAIKRGIALVPEDRKTQGLCLELSLRKNITASSIKARSRFGFIRKRIEINFVKDFISSMAIKARNSETRVGTLSGGNQQKVVLGKGLGIKPRVLLFNEPTRGVDVETKAEFYKLIRELSNDGIAVIMYSSDLIELCGMSDKVVVMYEGEISSILESDKISEESIMRAASGIAGNKGAA